MEPKLGMTIGQLDAADYLYGDGDPNAPGTKVLIEGTQRAVKNRNAKDGANTVFLARMVLVAVYDLWEDHYRSAIAKAHGVAKNDVRSDLFGDLRRYRHSIVHHRAIALDEAASNRVLVLFAPGQFINPSLKQMQTLIGLLADEVRRLGVAGEQPG